MSFCKKVLIERDIEEKTSKKIQKRSVVVIWLDNIKEKNMEEMFAQLKRDNTDETIAGCDIIQYIRINSELIASTGQDEKVHASEETQMDYNYENMKTEIKNTLSKFEENKINICICSRIFGGTGSGKVLEIYHLVGTIMQEIGRMQYNIYGYFFD